MVVQVVRSVMGHGATTPLSTYNDPPPLPPYRNSLIWCPLHVSLLRRSRMENVILIIHLFLALGLIAVVLMQRSEGGGLGMGSGGGGASGAMTGRGTASALSKLTWVLALGFICTSIALTIIAAQNASGSSVLDRLGILSPTTEEANPKEPATPLGSDLLPPLLDETAPLVPRAE